MDQPTIKREKKKKKTDGVEARSFQTFQSKG
jgi:hypothetical protein